MNPEKRQVRELLFTSDLLILQTCSQVITKNYMIARAGNKVKYRRLVFAAFFRVFQDFQLPNLIWDKMTPFSKTCLCGQVFVRVGSAQVSYFTGSSKDRNLTVLLVMKTNQMTYMNYHQRNYLRCVCNRDYLFISCSAVEIYCLCVVW